MKFRSARSSSTSIMTHNAIQIVTDSRSVLIKIIHTIILRKQNYVLLAFLSEYLSVAGILGGSVVQSRYLCTRSKQIGCKM